MKSGTLPRRAVVAASLAIACLAARAHGEEAAAAARNPQRVALMARAQAELQRGEAVSALDDFERAAMMLHAADAELGLIRAAMQDGQYRRALAFCAHTAGEHDDTSDGAALYAWLLRIGGQDAPSERVMAELRGHAAGDELTREVDAALAVSPPVATTPLLLAPLHRMAPWPVAGDGVAPPPDARLASNAVLLDDGATALVPAAAVTAVAGRVWVRNGLGESTEATREVDEPALAARGLARLRLHARLPVGDAHPSGGRAPFAGSAGYAVQYGATASPAWPALAQGFLGGLIGDSDWRRLGFAADAGAPVLDAQGSVVGIVVGTSNGQSAWLPLAVLQPMPAAAFAGAPREPAAARGLTAPDAIYESGLRRALQVLFVAP